MNAIYPDQPMTARRARMIAQKGESLVRELERLGEGADLPEWIQAKIESSYQMIDSAFDYLEQMDEISEIKEIDLLKARATKYTYRKRVGTNPKTGAATYRYFYNKPKTGKGIQSRTEDIKEGAAFVFHHNGQRGHFHVEKVKGKKLTIVHDETGHSVDVTQKELYALLLHEHKSHLEEHAEHTAKRAVERGRKTKSGTHKGAERRAERAAELAQEAKSAGESVAAALGDTPKKEPTPSADNFETMPEGGDTQKPLSTFVFKTKIEKLKRAEDELSSFTGQIHRDGPHLTKEQEKQIIEKMQAEIKARREALYEGFKFPRSQEELERRLSSYLPKMRSLDYKQGEGFSLYVDREYKEALRSKIKDLVGDGLYVSQSNQYNFGLKVGTSFSALAQLLFALENEAAQAPQAQEEQDLNSLEANKEYKQRIALDLLNQSAAFKEDLVFTKKGTFSRARNRNKIKGRDDNGAYSTAGDIVNETMTAISPSLLNHGKRPQYEERALRAVTVALSNAKGMTREEIAPVLHDLLKKIAKDTGVLKRPSTQARDELAEAVAPQEEPTPSADNFETMPKVEAVPTPPTSPAREELAEATAEATPSADNFETMPNKVPDGTAFRQFNIRYSKALDLYSDEQFVNGLKAVAHFMNTRSELSPDFRRIWLDKYIKQNRNIKYSRSLEHNRQMGRDFNFRDLAFIYEHSKKEADGKVPSLDSLVTIFKQAAGEPQKSRRDVTKSLEYKTVHDLYLSLIDDHLEAGSDAQGGLKGLYKKKIWTALDRKEAALSMAPEEHLKRARLYIAGIKDGFVEFSADSGSSPPVLKTDNLPSDLKGDRFDKLLKHMGLFYQRLVDTHIENKEEADLLARYAESPLEDKTPEELEALKNAARVVEAKGDNQTDFERGAVSFILNEIEALTNPRIKSRRFKLRPTYAFDPLSTEEKRFADAFDSLKPTESADNFETMPEVEAVPTTPTSPAREVVQGESVDDIRAEFKRKVEANEGDYRLYEDLFNEANYSETLESVPNSELFEHPITQELFSLGLRQQKDPIYIKLALGRLPKKYTERLYTEFLKRYKETGERPVSEAAGVAILQSYQEHFEQGTDKKAQTEREQAIASLDQPLELAGIKPSELSLEDAISSYRATSWQYERRGQDDLLDFQRDLKNLERKGFEYIKQGAPRSEVAYVISTGAQKMLDARRALNAARSRTMSAMITGRGNFPVRSQRKKMDVYDKRLDEYVQAGARTLKRLKKLDPKTPQPIRQGSGVSAYGTKLAKLEALQEAYKEKRREARAKGLKPNDVIPRYLLTNNSAQIRRVREQIREEEERKETLDSSEKFEDYTLPDGLELQVEKDQSDNRLRLHLSDKPDAETRRKIKARGFKWSRLNSAWQRILTSNSLAILPLVLAELGAKKESEESKESADNFETMPEVEEQQAPSKLSEEAQAAFQNLDKILGTLERMESTRTPAGRIKDWYDVKMYRDEFNGYLSSLFEQHFNEHTLQKLGANDNYSSGKLFIYKPAKSTATAEEVAEAHRERRSFLKLVRKTFEETVTKETEAPTAPASPAREELAQVTETAIQASQPKADDMSDEELTSAIKRQDAEVLDLGTEIDELKRQRKSYGDKSKQRKEAKARLNELKTAQASRKGEKVELKGEGANVPPENEMKAMISKLQTMVENNPSLAKSPEIMALLGGGATQASDLPDTDLVITLGGKTQNLPVRYKIVEAGDAIGSHNAGGFYKRTDYPEGIQEREYHNARGPEQNKVIVQAQNLNPQLLANTNPDAMNGPPILTQDGIALGGNSRVMSVQRAYLAHPDKAKAYKTYLYKKAHTFGIDPNSLDQFSAPLLVRELVVEDKSKENLSKLVRAMNEGLTQEFDATAEGRNAATKLLGENVTLKAIASALRDSPESATINSILKTPSTRLENIKRALFRDGIMTSRNSNKYIHEASGAFNDTGVSLVKKMITGYVLRDDELLRALSPRTEDNLNNALATLSAVGINREDANAVQDAVFIYNLILNKDIETGGINSTQSPQERDKRVKMYIEEDRAFDFGSGVSDKINIERMKDRVKKNPLSSAFLKILALNPTPRALNSTMKQFVKLVDVSDNMDMFAAAPVDFTVASKQIAQKLADQHKTSADLYKSHRGRRRFGSARLELLRALA